MTTIQKPNNLYVALLAAQQEMPHAIINKTNPHFKNKYADLEAVMTACVPVLNKHGILVSQVTTFDEQGRFVLQTDIIHAETGEARRAVMPLPETGKSQEIGSSITYAKRYTLATAAGLTAEEDDDGEAARQGEARPKASPKVNGNADPAAAKAMQIKSVMEKCGTHGAIDQVLKENADHIAAMPPAYQERLEQCAEGFKQSLALEAA